MRPHTLTLPKPLLSIAGKSLVERIVDEIINSYIGNIEEIAFIIGDFGEEVKKKLIDIAESKGAKGKIYYQDKPLGTGHAIFCAHESLQGPCIVVFADTLFKGIFNITNQKNIIWTCKVEDPSQYGVVKNTIEGKITDFVEKPKEYISNNAIIGIYYFQQAELLRNDLKRLLDNNIMVNGEFQLTDSLKKLLTDGENFEIGEVDEWLDCGNKNEFLKTNRRILEIEAKKQKETYLGNNVIIENSIIGNYVSIDDDCVIKNSTLYNCLIYKNTHIIDSEIFDSMVGNNCIIRNQKGKFNIGDYSSIENQ